MQQQLDQMRALALRHVRDRRTETAIPGLTIFRGHETTSSLPVIYEPVLCLILQGAKEVMIGGRVLRYDPANYFIATVELAACGRIVRASPDQPYLGLSLALDQDALAALLPEVPPCREAPAAGYGVSPVTPQLLDPWLRLLGLLDLPDDIPVLAPLLGREILYRLLQGPQGGVLRQAALADSRLSQIRRSLAWIRAHYDQPLRVEALAAQAGMSPASFHRHFKAATAMSPLQYQKNLRLQRARLLLIANQDASQAAYAVGYESTSQFSREYARLFGCPPVRDAERLRGDSAVLAAIASAA